MDPRAKIEVNVGKENFYLKSRVADGDVPKEMRSLSWSKFGGLLSAFAKAKEETGFVASPREK